MDTSGSGRAELDAGPLALEQIKGLSDRLALGGALSLRVEATAARGDVKALAVVQVKDARAVGLGLGAGRLTARVDGRRLQANLDLAERRITASATGGLEPGGVIDATLDMGTLELTRVLRHFSANPDLDTEIGIAGRATALVPWDRPQALTARLRLDPVTLRAKSAGLDGKGHVAARWDSGTLTIE